jgi:hypothetical protein
MIGLLTLIFAVDAAGKIVIACAILLFFFGARRLVGAMGATPNHVLFFLPVILIPTHFFFSGELSHLIGLGFSFFYLDHLLRRLDDPESLRSSSLAALGSLTFISSFAAYAPIALISFVVAIGVNRCVAWKKLGLASVPPLVMLAWYTVARAASGEVTSHSWTRWTSVGMLVGNMVDLLAPFQGFAPWVEASTPRLRILAVVNAAFCVALAALVIWSIWRWNRGDTRHNVVLAAALVTFAAALAAGRNFTDAAIGERFIFPALMVLCAWMGSEWRAPRLNDPAIAVAIVLILINGIYLHQTIIPVSHALSAELADLNSARTPDEFDSRCACHYN